MDFLNVDFTVYIIYLITREDGKQYVGTTNSKRLYHRMYHHKYTNRFKNKKFTYQIIACWNTPEIFNYEEYFINKYDTFYNGLNKSKNGKGNHLCPTFTTLGWKMPEHVKRKIGEKSKIARKSKGHRWSAQSRQNASRIRKGKVFRPRKFSLELIEEIKKHYRFRPKLNNVGKVQKNGKILNYERAFANTFSSKYNMTSQFLYSIVKSESKLKDAA